MADHPPARRVKVYVLKEDGKWDDRATGHVRWELDQAYNAYVVKVTADETGHIALRTTLRASSDANYQMRDEKIISWNEPSLTSDSGKPHEVALFFAEQADCRDLWQTICLVDSNQKVPDKPHSAPPARPPVPPRASNALVTASSAMNSALDDPVLTACISPPPDAMQTASAAGSALSLVDPAAQDAAHASRFLDDHLDAPPVWSNTETLEDVLFRDNNNVLFLPSPTAPLTPAASTAEVVASAQSNQPFPMPPPDRAGIEVLSKVITNNDVAHLPSARERISSELSSGEYIDKFCQLFRTAESAAASPDYEFLVDLYIVAHFFFAVADSKVLEFLLSEKYFMDIVGCLEYAPDRVTSFLRPSAHADSSDDIATGSSSDEIAGDEPDSEPNSSTSAPATAQNGTTPKDGETDTSSPSSSDSPTRSGEQKNADAAEIAQTEPTSDPEEKSDNALAEPNRESDTGTAAATSESCAPASAPTAHAGASDTKNRSEDTATSSGNISGDGNTDAINFRAHRTFLQRRTLYKGVVPIGDAAVLAKIHQNFRAAYVRDAIFRTIGDNPLSGIILFNNIDIIMYFISGNALQELFESLRSAMRSRETRNESSATADAEESNGNSESLRKECRTSTGKSPVLSGSCSSTQEEDGSTNNVQLSPKERTKPHQTLSDDAAKAAVCIKNIDSFPATETVPDVDQEKETSTSNDLSSQPPDSEAKVNPDSATADPKSSEPGEGQSSDLWNMLRFLKELCRIVKGQQAALKNRFHTLLLELGIFDICLRLLRDDDSSLRALSCELLWSVVMHDQAEVRTHILKVTTQKDSSKAPPSQGSASAQPLGRVDGPTAAVRNNDISGSFADASKKDLVMEDCDEPNSMTVSPGDMIDVGNVSPGTASSDLKSDKDSPELRKLAEVALHANDQPPLINDPTSAGGGSSYEKNPVPKASFSNQLQESVGGISPPENSENPTGIAPGSHALRSERFFPLLQSLLDVIRPDDESGIAMTVLDLLKSLLDPTNMRTHVENSLFLSVFYEKFIGKLLTRVTDFSVGMSNGTGTDPEPPSWVATNVGHIVDVFSFCLKYHMYLCKFFVIQNDVGGKVEKLMRHHKPHVQLAAARFIRACVGSQDDMMDRYLTRQRLLGPLLDMFQKNKNKDNMVSSVVLELLSFIHKEKRMIIIGHIVWNYRGILESSKIANRYLTKILQLVKTAAFQNGSIAVKASMGGNERMVPQGGNSEIIGHIVPVDGTVAKSDSTIQAILHAQMTNTRVLQQPSDGKQLRVVTRAAASPNLLSQISDLGGHINWESQNVLAAMARMMEERGTLQFQRLFERRRKLSRQSRDMRKKESFVGNISGPSSTTLKSIGKQKRPRISPTATGTTGRVQSRPAPIGRFTGLRSKAVDTVIKPVQQGTSAKVPSIDKRIMAVPGAEGFAAKNGKETLTSHIEVQPQSQATKPDENGAQSVKLVQEKANTSLQISPVAQQPCDADEKHDVVHKRIRLSLSKSGAAKAKSTGVIENGVEGEWVSESSEDERESKRSDRKEHVLHSGAIETSTSSVLGRRKSEDDADASDSSPPKRPRATETSTGRSDGGEDCSEKADAEMNDVQEKRDSRMEKKVAAVGAEAGKRTDTDKGVADLSTSGKEVRSSETGVD